MKHLENLFKMSEQGEGVDRNGNWYKRTSEVYSTDPDNDVDGFVVGFGCDGEYVLIEDRFTLERNWVYIGHVIVCT